GYVLILAFALHRWRRTASTVVDDLESAVDQALAVERHGIDIRLHARVGHHLFHPFVALLAGRPKNPGEDNGFIRLLLHRHRKRRDLTVGHIVAPAFHYLQGSIFFEQGRSLLGVLAVFLPIGRRNRGDKSIDIGHGSLLRLYLRG